MYLSNVILSHGNNIHEIFPPILKMRCGRLFMVVGIVSLPFRAVAAAATTTPRFPMIIMVHQCRTFRVMML